MTLLADLTGVEIPQPPFAIYDTETSGLPNHWWARIVQMSILVVLPSGRRGPTWTTHVRWDPREFKLTEQEKRQAKKAFEYTGIPLADVTRAPTAAEVWGQLGGWTRTFPQSVPLHAYNERFDRVMMNKTFGPCGCPELKPKRCLQQMARDCTIKGMKRFNLLKFCERHELTETGDGQTHQADVDVELTYRVWRLLWEAQGHQVGDADLDIAWAQVPQRPA